MRKILLAAGLAVLATACRFEMNLGVDINADGSGTITYEAGLDEEAVRLVPAGALENPAAGSPLALIPGTQLGEEDRGGLHYYIVTVDVDDIATALDDIVEQADDAIVEDFSLTVTDDRVTFAATASAAAAFAEMADMTLPGQLEQVAAANFVLTLPGEIIEHDADSRDGNTLTWSLPVTGGDTVEINAASNPAGSSGGGFPAWVIGLAAAVVLAGAAGFFLLSRRGSGTEQPDEPPPLNEPAAE